MDFIQFSYKGDEELSMLSIKSIVKNVKNIGSIVLLKGATKKMMIFGIKQLDEKNQEVECNVTHLYMFVAG